MKFTYYIATSLDGFIARSDGSVDWLPQSKQGGEDYGYSDFYNSVDALVIGRVTYEQILGFGDWPYPNNPTFILTSSSLTTNRNDVKIVAAIDQLIDELNQSGYRHIWLVGGGTTAGKFLDNQLIDRVIQTIVPIALGEGIPLFVGHTIERELQIERTCQFADGFVQISYEINTEV